MKIIEKPDGSRELEGTPEELANFENKRSLIRFGAPQPIVIQPIPYQPYAPYPYPAPYIIYCNGASIDVPTIPTVAGNYSD